MRKVVLVIILISGALSSFAQLKPELEKKYINETIYRYGGNFMKGTERLTFRDLAYEFSFSPVGEDSYLIAKKYRNTSYVLRFISLAAGITAFSLAIKNRDVTAYYVGLGMQIGLSLAGAHYQNLSTKQLDKALWQRNKDLLFPPK